jgi:5'/3'-nucleotidase
MRILVTNDDGVQAPGILALARALADASHDVVVAAPLSDRSGSGTAIAPADVADGVPTRRLESDGLEGVPVFGLDAPPALIVLSSRLGGFGDPPELVASGINAGPNTGRSILHSGTVGAVLTAASSGLLGLAVSASVGDPMWWGTAAGLAVAAVEWLAEAPRRTALNLNVPNLAPEEVGGVRWARLAPFGTVQAAVSGAEEGRLQIEFGATRADLDDDTDTALVRAGYATVTSILGVRADEDPGVAPHLERRLPELRAP